MLFKQYLVLCLLCLYLGGLHNWCLFVDFGLKLAVNVNNSFSLAPQGLTLTLLFCEALSHPHQLVIKFALATLHVFCALVSLLQAALKIVVCSP